MNNPFNPQQENHKPEQQVTNKFEWLNIQTNTNKLTIDMTFQQHQQQQQQNETWIPDSENSGELSVPTLTYEESVIWREFFIQQDSTYWNDLQLDMANLTTNPNFTIVENDTWKNMTFGGNGTSIGESMDVLTMVLTASMLGLVILATVIGKCLELINF